MAAQPWRPTVATLILTLYSSYLFMPSRLVYNSFGLKLELALRSHRIWKYEIVTLVTGRLILAPVTLHDVELMHCNVFNPNVSGLTKHGIL